MSLMSRDRTQAPAVEVRGLSHWTTRKSSIRGWNRRLISRLDVEGGAGAETG